MAATVMAVAAVVSVGMGAYSLATQPGAPDQPSDLGQQAAIEAEAATLPARRAYEAAARQGTTVLRNGYAEIPATSEQRGALQSRLEQAQSALARLERPKGYQQLTPEAWRQYQQTVPNWEQTLARQDPEWAQKKRAAQAELAGLQGQLAAWPADGGALYVDPSGNVVSKESAVIDFTGYGEADVQGKIAREMAQNLLDLEEKYGPQFIAEALKQEQQADPEAYAARQKLYDLVKQQAGAEPDRPVADLLDEQIAGQLAAGQNLDRLSEDLLREAVGEANAVRGGDAADTTRYDQPLTEGFAGEERARQARQKALGWLTSGATPEDVAYRRAQQTMANEASVINNVTPQSQFGSLSGAQRGATPYYPGPAAPQNNGSAGQAAQSAALQTWQMQTDAEGQQADPWMAGLSTLLSGLTVAGQAGWKPFGTN